MHTWEVGLLTFICLSHVPLNFLWCWAVMPSIFEINTNQFRYCMHAFPIPLIQTHGNSKIYTGLDSILSYVALPFVIIVSIWHLGRWNMFYRSQEGPKDHTQNH
jgi:hypothetical protein